MNTDLSQCRWELTGWRPLVWKYARSLETTFWLEPEIGPLQARLPGSVQQNLLDAGLLPDWHDGLNARAVEWVEHRHWMFEAELPEMEAAPTFVAESLDYSGWILVNRRVAGLFRGPHQPVEIDLDTAWGTGQGPRRLAIVFAIPPELHGQVGYTSETRELRPRYTYGWDWCPRLVASGARGTLSLISSKENAIRLIAMRTELEADFCTGHVMVRLQLPEPLHVEISAGGKSTVLEGATGSQEIALSFPSPSLWWPNGQGNQTLYEVKIVVRGKGGEILRKWTRQVGFKHVEWRPCEGAPKEATPWICVINGRPIFLQGVNWTPARLADMDTTRGEMERLVGLYREMGCNILRVWGGASLESEEFYAACDRAGLLVWQEFPLSSSGLDNVPPRDLEVIGELGDVARHFIRARQHHASLLIWCGGNELQEGYENEDRSQRHPCNEENSCLKAFAEIVASEDPGRRYLPTSPSGPVFLAHRENFGKGLHHHVHGPWGLGDFRDLDDWRDYWENDDALFRSEVGVPGMADEDVLHRHADGHPLWPLTSPLWRHTANWWTQEQRLGELVDGLSPSAALLACIDHTQREQAEGLAIAAKACKDRFPRCGGFIVWMGHDCFPCPANTSLIDFTRNPKPAWHTVQSVFLATNHDREVLDKVTDGFPARGEGAE